MASAMPASYEASSESGAEALLANHRRLIYFATNRYIRARPDLEEDIIAVARAELLEAAKSYRADAGVAFTTVAVNRMRWGVGRFMREFTKHDRFTKSLNEPVSYDDDGVEFTLFDVVDQLEGARKMSESLAEERRLARIHDLRRAIAACKTLTPSERRILGAFLESGSREIVAACLGLTTARVGQALSKSAFKLRKHLFTIRTSY